MGRFSGRLDPGVATGGAKRVDCFWTQVIEPVKSELVCHSRSTVSPKRNQFSTIDLGLGIPCAASRITPWQTEMTRNDGRRTENFSVPGTSAYG